MCDTVHDRSQPWACGDVCWPQHPRCWAKNTSQIQILLASHFEKKGRDSRIWGARTSKSALAKSATRCTVDLVSPASIHRCGRRAPGPMFGTCIWKIGIIHEMRWNFYARRFSEEPQYTHTYIYIYIYIYIYVCVFLKGHIILNINNIRNQQWEKNNIYIQYLLGYNFFSQVFWYPISPKQLK